MNVSLNNYINEPDKCQFFERINSSQVKSLRAVNLLQLCHVRQDNCTDTPRTLMTQVPNWHLDFVCRTPKYDGELEIPGTYSLTGSSCLLVGSC